MDKGRSTTRKGNPAVTGKISKKTAFHKTMLLKMVEHDPLIEVPEREREVDGNFKLSWEFWTSPDVSSRFKR